MQKQLNAVANMAQTQEAIGVRHLVRFGITMGIALAGQILVTISLGTIPWMQSHVLTLVLIELVWWPPFFCILYFSFVGVVKLVELSVRSHKSLHRQFVEVCQDYEGRCDLYEQRLEEQNRYIHRVSRSAREKISAVHLEPLSKMDA